MVICLCRFGCRRITHLPLLSHLYIKRFVLRVLAAAPAAVVTETAPSVTKPAEKTVVVESKPEPAAEAQKPKQQQTGSGKQAQEKKVEESTIAAEDKPVAAAVVPTPAAPAPVVVAVKESLAAVPAAPVVVEAAKSKEKPKVAEPVDTKKATGSNSSSSNATIAGNNSNKSGGGAGNGAPVSSSGKKNETTTPAPIAGVQVNSSSNINPGTVVPEPTVDEIDKSAPVIQATSVKSEIVDPVPKMVDKAVAEEVSAGGASIAKEEKEIINYKKEKEASVESDELAQKKESDPSTPAECGDEVEIVKEVGSEKPGAVKLVLQYDEGQWSPLNVTGRKVYTMEQMRQLQAQPVSQSQPPKAIDDPFLRANPDAKKGQSSSMSGGGGGGGGGGGAGVVNLFPHFYADMHPGMQRPNNYNSKRNHSQTGGGGGGGGGQNQGGDGGKKPQIIISLSLNNDVKLNQAENAWRPSGSLKKSKAAVVEKEDTRTEEEKKTDAVYKAFRIILNKLTPENFEKLAENVKELEINTEERVNACMQMVFEKAVIEPNYTLTYAVLCKEVAQMGPSQSMDFRNIMLMHCQQHFETLSNLEETKKKRQERLAKLKQVAGAGETDQYAELKATLEEEERKERHRSVGIVRFIGELFKQSWISQKIIVKCINVLVETRDEEYLECLCKLLTTIGPRTDKTAPIDHVWPQLQDIAQDKKKLSSRVRFMILDLLDLRKNRWVPRRTESKPKAISQIHKEEERAFLNNQEEQRAAQLAASARGSMSKNNSSGGGGIINMSGPRSSNQGADNDQRSFNKNSQRRRTNDPRDNRSSYNDRNTSSNSADAGNQGANNNTDDGEWIKAPSKRTTIDPAKFKTKPQVSSVTTLT